MANPGILTISGGNSRLDGTLLAKSSDPRDPLAEATRFLKFERGLKDGERIKVTGSEGRLDPNSDVTVIFISDAERAPNTERAPEAMALGSATAPTKKTGQQKTALKAPRKKPECDQD